MMKNFYHLLLVPFFLFSVSCSKDDNNKNEDETASLAGEWQMEEFQYNGTTTVRQGEMVDQSSYTGTAKNIDVFIDFNESADTWESGGSYVIELVTIVNGETQTSEVPHSNIVSSGTYSIDGDMLSLGYTADMGAMAIDEATITKLTESELVLEFEYSETSEVSGFKVDLVIDGIQRFSR